MRRPRSTGRVTDTVSRAFLFLYQHPLWESQGNIVLKTMAIIKIGRSSANDVVIDSPVVSSQHASISISDTGDIVIKDLNSSNGTFVNGERINSHILKPDDNVRLANIPFNWQKVLNDYKEKTKISEHKSAIIPPDVVNQKLVGKGGVADIVFPYDDVSRKHAFLCQKANGEIQIIDNNSTNGTYVNGLKVDSCVLKRGDKVLIAKKYSLDWEKEFGVGKQNMLKLFVAAVAAILIILAGTIGYLRNRPWEPEDIYSCYKNSVVLIVQNSCYQVTANGRSLGSYYEGLGVLDECHLDSDGDLAVGGVSASGTGFFISTDGQIMTNKHVLYPVGNDKKDAEIIKRQVQSILRQVRGLAPLAEYVEVKYRLKEVCIARNDSYVNSSSDLIPCSVFKVSDNDDLDIAIIQINNKQTPSDVTHLVNIDDYVKGDGLKIGKKVYTIGFPYAFTLGDTSIGLEANNQSGEITQERGEYTYGHNITIQHGASGSPVFNEYGKFAGVIVSGFLGISQGYNHAINPEPINKFTK